MSNIIYIVASILFNVAGQTAVKYGTTQFGEITLPLSHPLALITTILKIIFYPYILLGILSYSFGAILWIVALSKNELSFAYPFYGLGFILIMIISWLLFKEEITIIRILGTAFIFLGIYFIFQS